MLPVLYVAICLTVTAIVLHRILLKTLFFHPTARIPGPRLYALTRWRLAWEDWKGSRTRTIDRLHKHYGPVVRIGPNEVHFNSLSALRTIYGAGSSFGRSEFYRMFDVYGKPNLFTFHSSRDHSNRKKLLAHAYSKSVMLRGTTAEMVEGKVKEYLDLLEREGGRPNEIFSSLHYFALDTITTFLYGPELGGTSAMAGKPSHRALLSDIMDPSRRRLSWFVVHLPALTRWLYSRTSVLERLVRPLLPMQKPATYSGIRAYALDAWRDFEKVCSTGKGESPTASTVIDQLFKFHQSQTPGGLDDLDIASECADHLLAGIDTTSDTLMFLIWALSLPDNVQFQEKLVDEIKRLEPTSLNGFGNPTMEASDKLEYLDAVIKETLRLYAPLPAMEPRSRFEDTVIDGYHIPADTVVGMSPYSLHRNADVFPHPLTFNPDRWRGTPADVAEMKKWFWAFSSGGRMCIGSHLAMAEMTSLVASLYRTYRTSLPSGFEGSPAITSRFEVFYDESFPTSQEHQCSIKFDKLA